MIKGNTAFKLRSDTKLWVVVDAGPDSTLADVLFQTTPKGIALQGRGGWNLDDNPSFYSDTAIGEPVEAMRDARERLDAAAAKLRIGGAK